MMSITSMASAQSCPDNNHPHVIDLGLPSGTKWACCNVGASTPMDNGGYYAWGETDEKETYNWDNYSHYSNGKCLDIGYDIANTQYDVAHVKWGGAWVIPSMEQIQELFDNCTYTYTRIETDATFGGLFTGPNGNAIFLPPAHPIRNGNSQDDDILDSSDGEMNSANDEMPPYGAYWSSNPRSPDSTVASDRAEGLSVRPVTSGTVNIINPESYTGDSGKPFYNIYGIRVVETIDNIKVLPPGIYIKDGKKYILRQQ